MLPIDSFIRYPDATMCPTESGQWKLTPMKGPSSLHASRDDAYDALMEIRERNCGGDEGCLMCGS